MENEGLPCLKLLDSTPDILRGLTSELTEENARWNRRRTGFPSRKCRRTSPIPRVTATACGWIDS